MVNVDMAVTVFFIFLMQGWLNRRFKAWGGGYGDTGEELPLLDCLSPFLSHTHAHTHTLSLSF